MGEATDEGESHVRETRVVLVLAIDISDVKREGEEGDS